MLLFNGHSGNIKVCALGTKEEYYSIEGLGFIGVDDKK
jgi:hypothetical protein